LISHADLIRRAGDLIAANGFRLDPKTRVADLTPAGRQLVEICRAIAQGSSLLIFDEPTSSLSEAETVEVFRIVMDLKRRDMGVIYITHRLEELRSVGDMVTVLRDGATVHTAPLADLSRDELIQHMVGRSMDSVYRRVPTPAGETLLRASNLSRGILKNISFELRAGEIVGLAGLMGAGRTELCRVLFGIDRAETGTLEVMGKPVTPKSPRQGVQNGIALIPEDRQNHGLALRLPIAWNMTLSNLDSVSTFGFLRKRAELSMCSDFCARLKIRTASPAQLAGRLSGGNQQKIVIAKWVASGARIFLFDEPTRGIDISAKQEVFEQMDLLARSGAAVLMVSSELPELLQVADRILVMKEGRLCGELPGQTTQEAIMTLASPCASHITAASA
jgi:ABC-type sugar transport system ATPase subunit